MIQILGNSGVITSSSSSGSTSITIPDNTNMCVVFASGVSSSGFNGSVSIGGVSSVEIAVTFEINSQGCFARYVINSGVGSKTFAWTLTETPDQGANFVVVYLSGVDTSNPIRGYGITPEGYTPPKVTSAFSSSSTDLVLACYGAWYYPMTLAVEGQTEILTSSRYRDSVLGLAYKAGVDGTTTITWGYFTWEEFTWGMAIGFSVIAASDPGPSPGWDNISKISNISESDIGQVLLIDKDDVTKINNIGV